MKVKTCSKCKKVKSLSEFYKDSSKKSGLRPDCKKCQNKIIKIYYIKNKSKKLKYAKQYREKNKSKIYNYQIKYRKINKKRRIEYFKKYYLKNKKSFEKYRKEHKDQIKEGRKRYYKLNKKRLKKYREEHKEYFKNYSFKNKEKLNKNIRLRKKHDIHFKIVTNLRTRLSQAIKQNIKSGHTIKLIGCTIKQLKQHLEKRFKSGMNWNNYGRGCNGKGMQEWHIDHVKPCCTFDLSKPSEQRKCFHYTNLQPLWAKENREKWNNFKE